MTLDEVLEDSWARLREGVERRKSPYHLATLATVGPGGPEVRTVVLRAADRAQGTVRFHTDARSAKAGEIAADARVSLLFYDPGEKVQLRVAATAALHVGDDVARGVWSSLSPLCRRTYMGPAAPGMASAEMTGGLPPELAERVPEEWRWDEGFERFALAVCTAHRLDWLRLGFAGHARARFERVAGEWRGSWVVP